MKNVARSSFRHTLAGIMALSLCLSGSAVRADETPPPPPLPAGGSAPFQAPDRTLPFVNHGMFFSQETRRAPAIDPQVFARDDAVAAGTGPQNITHPAGLRPIRLDDEPETVVLNAQGESLGFTLDRWFGSSGTLDIAPKSDGHDRLTFSFKKLIAFGVYSLFLVTFSPDGTTFKPLEGGAGTNTFTATADGAANLVLTPPLHLTHARAVVLVYHSDDVEHQLSRGEIGVTAHHQLIARLP